MRIELFLYYIFINNYISPTFTRKLSITLLVPIMRRLRIKYLDKGKVLNLFRGCGSFYV